jgi:G:T-mismatch repair DNA endonuclease (very short patch repair protein)
MGQDSEAGARATRRAHAAIDASIADLEPKWLEAFDRDVERDSAFERSLLVREWAIVVVVVLLVLLRRLVL